MRIIGIDPGLQRTGWGVIEYRGNTLSFIASGLIRTQPDAPLSVRLAEIDRGLSAAVLTFMPAGAAVEETFVNSNAASALKLGMARGVAVAVPARHDLPVGEYAPNLVMKSVVVTGHATKDQIGAMIRRLMPQSGKISADEADALAIAVCHAHHVQMTQRLKAAAAL